MIQLGDNLVYHGQEVIVEEILEEEGGGIFFFQGGAYLLNEAFPSHWGEGDYKDALSLIEAATTPKEIAAVKAILTQICSQTTKKELWKQLTKSQQKKLKTT